MRINQNYLKGLKILSSVQKRPGTTLGRMPPGILKNMPNGYNYGTNTHNPERM